MSEAAAQVPEPDEDEPTISDPSGEPKTGDVDDTITEPEGSTTEPPDPSPEPTEPSEPEPAEPVEPAEPAEPEATLGMSEREFEQAAKKLDRGVERYRAVVQEFIETTGQSLIENKADLSHVPGYIFHPDVKPLDEEQAAFARATLGMPIEPAFSQDPESHECADCSGWGRVKTGSKVAGQNVKPCHRCGGHGYISSRGYETPAPQSLRVVGDEPAPVLTPEQESGEDSWGTPRSHPDWGKMPQYRSPNWQAELEAYKAGLPAPIE